MSDKPIKSADCEEIEKKEIGEIMKCVNNFSNFVVKAGAGSGKTYSLVEIITNILEEKYEMLMLNNQKILCITYTNAAADEIKERVGNTSIVRVSTIHDFLWDTIKSYQPELVELHVIKIGLTIENIDKKLSETGYNDLHDSEKEELKTILIQKRDKYYRIRSMKANPFREQLSPKFKEQFADVLNNVNTFKKITNNILFRDRLNQSLENIDRKKDNYIKVEYDANLNNDRLSSMKISHDTLLEYSRCLVEKYDLLRTIIVDRYPYILVDEFQDTNPLVIDLLRDLSEFKLQKDKEFLIGFFGDENQNIYDTGIGKQLSEKIDTLHVIEKKYNYRSSEAVIKLANFTRLDNLMQESAYSNNPLGETNFIVINVAEEERRESVDSIIERYKDRWNINEDNKLGIFITMNKYLSNINGFEKIYNFFYNSPYYRSNWEQINQEFLSKNIDKLGESLKKLYNILYFRNLIEEKDGAIKELISQEVLKNMNYFELKEFYNEIITLNNTSTLSDFIKKSISLLNNSELPEDINKWGVILSKFYDLDSEYEFTYENIVEGFIRPLVTRETSDEDSDELKDKFYKLLEETIEPFVNWFDFITSDSDRSVTYSTIHGTKGTEFDNVIIVLEKDFGSRNPNYFKNAITNIVNISELDPSEDEKEIIATNLLYVASTRARKNITFLYFGEIPSDEQEVLASYFDNYL